MHVPDGFFDPPTALGAAAVTAGTVAIALRRAGTELSDRMAPMAGLVAAFVFALQMLNFPVAAGTSGHLLGGALAAVLVGPWVAVLCIAVVLGVQGLLFADGGLTAYGLNVLLIGIVPAFVGWWAFRLARSVLPATDRSVVVASGIGAFVSVPAAATVFALLFAVGGAVDVSTRTVVLAMVGVHALVGIGEALITMAVVSAVVATRPDLVVGAADVGRPVLEPAVAP